MNRQQFDERRDPAPLSGGEQGQRLDQGNARSTIPLAAAALLLLALFAWGGTVSRAAPPSPPEQVPGTVPAPAPVPERRPAALALLVGIQEYATPREGEPLETLQGSEHDVQRFRALLVERFGFDPACIATLVGPAATHAAIVGTFHRHLIARAGPDTKVVFYFSGHGSRVPDQKRRDPSPTDAGERPFDETLVAYDSRAVDHQGGFDLTDDELHSLLAALPAKDVVVVTDCCHSGGVLRAVQAPGVRECAPGSVPLARERLDFWPAQVEFLDDDQDRDLPAVVHFAACGAQEEAGEVETPLGWFGTMTWRLCGVLSRIDPGASWREVAALVRAQVAGHGTRPAQCVQVVGDGERGVFGGRGRPVPPGYQVDRYGSRQLVIGGGSVQGLGVDAELRLMDLEARELGSARVIRVHSSVSIAEWAGQGPVPEVPMCAMPRTLGTDHAPLCVALGYGVDAHLLDGSMVATVAKQRADADYTIEREGDRLRLLDRQGIFVRPIAGDHAGACLDLLREHYYRALWTGVAAPGRFPIALAVAPVSEEEAKRLSIPPAAVRARVAEGGGFAKAVVGATVLDPDRRPSGGLIRIQVRNASEEDLHVAIISVAENREIRVVYGRDANNVVRAGGTFTKVVWVGLPQDWKERHPFVDRHVVVATPRYADFKPFESDAPLRAVRGSGEGSGLPPFLRAAMGGERVRGTELEKPAWGIAFCDLDVVTPEQFAASSGQ